jgi:F420H(2)-dependent quinone reductase
VPVHTRALSNEGARTTAGSAAKRTGDFAMSHAPKLRYVNPYVRRGRLYLALCRFSATQAGAWLSVNVAWKVDPHLLKLTGGRLSTAWPVAAALLETRGARTGQRRRNATLYFHDGGSRDDPSRHCGDGRRTRPGYFNLRRHPDVVFGGRPYRAEIVEDEAERRRLWDLADRVYPQFADLRERGAKAGRVIPIVQLFPRFASSTDRG